MEVIFEVINRSGRAFERRLADGHRLRIGRAFDNDLILSDETVDPHHAEIQLSEEGGLSVRDLNSLNGTKNANHAPVLNVVPIKSGDEYIFGRTRVRIFAPEHSVPPAISMGGFDGLIDRLGRGDVLVLLLVIVSAIALLGQWLSTYSDTPWQEYVIGVVSVMSASFAMAAFWSIVGRIVKHEARFAAQLGLVLTYLLLQTIIVMGYEVLLFNTLNVILSAAFSLVLSFILLTATLSLALHISTNQLPAQRLRYGASIAGMFICLSIYPHILKQTEFSDSPDYVKEMKPPIVRIVSGELPTHFVTQSALIFDKIEHDE